MTVTMYKRNKDMEIEDGLMIRNSSYVVFHFQTNSYSTTGHISNLQKNLLRTLYVNTTYQCTSLQRADIDWGILKYKIHTLLKLLFESKNRITKATAIKNILSKEIFGYTWWYLTVCKVSDITIIKVF